ncbi:MAG: phytanoyl-CoA dioxygenase family protein [Candidatus Poribacteria bacterium]|nr:phytanoyl-CoA dioxygenase family protein [Candidatus Poribacteria bacterium]
MSEPKDTQVSIEERFLFDLQGFLMLRGVLAPDECAEFLGVIKHLEGQTFEDKWMEAVGPGRPTRETSRRHQIRLNGLPRLDSIFDRLIDHPRVVPYLREFVGEPQLINTWSISKFHGAQQGGWHRGVPTTDYSYRNGVIRSRMFNLVYFLTDNGPEDGCIVALPGSHKSNFDLTWQNYSRLELPGTVAVTGSAGDVLMFSETVIHDGLPKTTHPVRSNLYYNYVHAHYNVMTREPKNCHHFYFPPEIRARFTPTQRELTAWMELARWEY